MIFRANPVTMMASHQDIILTFPCTKLCIKPCIFCLGYFIILVWTSQCCFLSLPINFHIVLTYSVVSCCSIACTVGIDRDSDCNEAITQTSLDQIYKAFLDAMNDYTTDSRGDVGAW